MTTEEIAIWDDLFSEVSPKDLAAYLMNIYCEQAEYKLENQDKIRLDDAAGLHMLKRVIDAIQQMEEP